MCISVFFLNFLVLFYFIAFTPKCFARAVAAISAEVSRSNIAEQNLQTFYNLYAAL